MDTAEVIFTAIRVLPRFLPKPKPPRVDYTQLIAQIPKPALEVSVPEPQEEIEAPTRQKTGCIPCSRSHLSAVSGALGESLRFAREDGIGHPEVQRRIALAEDEVHIMERIDLAPDALAKSPLEDRKLAEEYLPRIRALRQDIGQITSLEKLESVAAEASILGQEFRLRHLQLQGVDLNPVIALAKKVKVGEMSMEEARAKLKEILPEEEL